MNAHNAIKYADIAKKAVSNRDEVTQLLVHKLRPVAKDLYDAVGHASEAGEKQLDVLLGAIISIYQDSQEQAKAQTKADATRLLNVMTDTLRTSTARHIEREVSKFALDISREL